LGASEYYSINGIKEGLVPKVNSKKAIKLYKKIHTAIQSNIIKSAHDLSDGGVAVAISESAFSGSLGAMIDLDALGNDLSDEEKLFSETPSRILITVSAKDDQKILDIFKDEKIYLIGKTIEDQSIIIKSRNNVILKDDLKELKSIWKNALIF
jgi:phosphoribosylformylglycinamidine synthase